jgi:hypothetical protein
LLIPSSIVGASARNQFPAFQAALTFAHEYGIFAASLEDRPFVPVGTVVMQGAPKDFKRSFRKWDDSKQVTAKVLDLEDVGATWSSTKGGKAPSLRVVPLTAALEAVGKMMR